MRLLIAIGRLLRSDDSLIAAGLLTVAVVLSPPRGSAWSVVLVMAAAIALTGAALHAIRNATARSMRFARLGAWVRATAALAVSASIMMILDASVTAIG